MKCKETLDFFSDLIDGVLDPSTEARVREHIRSCSACHAQYESFRYATEDLRRLELAPTSEEHVAFVMEAVDRAAHEDAAGAGWVRVAPPVSTEKRHRGALRSFASALAGAAAIILFWPNAWLILGHEPSSADEKEAAPVPEKIVQVEGPERVVPERDVSERVVIEYVDRVVEVPVDRVVEVEKLVEVPIEVPVEVVRVVEKPVENPLQPDLDSFAKQMAIAFETVRVARISFDRAREDFDSFESVEWEPSNLAATDLESQRTEEVERESEAVAALEPDAQRSPVRVSRGEAGLRIRTSGTRSEVVPALISMLDGADPELAAAVEQELREIRREIGGPPVAALDDPEGEQDRSSLGRLRRLLTSLEDSSSRDIVADWRNWWSSSRERLAVLDRRGTF